MDHSESVTTLDGIHFSFFGNRAVVDSGEQQLYFDGRPVDLTSVEYDIVAYLGQLAGLVQTAEEIVNILWAVPLDDPHNTARGHIYNIRGKTDGGIIRTVRGVGYLATL